MIIVKKIHPDKAQELCMKICLNLPEYFGLDDINRSYSLGVRSCINIAAFRDEEPVGLISIRYPYPSVVNIYWMGILKNEHNRGIGKTLLHEALKEARYSGAKMMTVETLDPQCLDQNYLKTYEFYFSQGFKPFFSLKPEGYKWDMVYMARSADITICPKSIETFIRPLEDKDIPFISKAFNQIGWIDKNESLFERYLKEAERGERCIWVAEHNNAYAGYVTLNWQSEYLRFRENNIPEIMDLNVLPEFRKRSIGSMLLHTAEKKASTKTQIVGIGVGLYGGHDGGYGAAQRLYVKRGYIPDGQGAIYRSKIAIPGETYRLDDDLVLFFTKNL